MIMNPAEKVMLCNIGKMNAEDLHAFSLEMKEYISLVERQLESGGAPDIQAARKYELGGCRSILKISEELLHTKLKYEGQLLIKESQQLIKKS